MLEELWSVKIWNEVVQIDDDAHDLLHATAISRVGNYNGEQEIFNKKARVDNLFGYNDPIIQDFRSFMNDRVRKYIASEGFIDSDELSIEVAAFPRRFVKGQRARPHTHRGVDYVAVYYLDLDVESSGDTQDQDNGRFILIDPVAQRSRGLNHHMTKQYSPQKKSLIIHPAYLFHETEMYKGDKPRDMIVMNIRVLDRQQSGEYLPL